MAKIEMPSSSINSTGETPKKQLKKVTTGKVTIKQESEIQKLAHNFLAEDLQTIREKLWTDYILPGIKNMVCSAVNIALFGVDRSRTNTNGYSQQRNSYSSYYANANQSRPPQNNYRPNRSGSGKRLGFCSTLQCIWKIRCGAHPCRRTGVLYMAAEDVWQKGGGYHPWGV